MSLEPGSTLGPYHILGELSRGGTAVRYKAHDPRLDRFVAIKVVQPLFAEQAGFAARFEREAIAVAKLRHPHILKVHDYGNENGVAYMVTDFVEGGSLVTRLGAPLPPVEVATLLSGLGSALDYAHQHEVLHRRIKPDNILLWEDGTAVLSDFGLARHTDTSVNMTGASELLASMAYMAPELVEGAPAGPVTDRYALAVVAYELLTGVALFNPSTPASELVAHAAKPLAPPRSINPSLSQAVERVLVRALARQPEQRYASATEFTAALHEANERDDGVEEHAAPSTLMHSPDAPLQSVTEAAAHPDPVTSAADAPTMQILLPARPVATTHAPPAAVEHALAAAATASQDATSGHLADDAPTMTTIVPHHTTTPDHGAVAGVPAPVADATDSTIASMIPHFEAVAGVPAPIAENLAPTMTTIVPQQKPVSHAEVVEVAAPIAENLAPTLTIMAPQHTPMPHGEAIDVPAPVADATASPETLNAPSPPEGATVMIAAPASIPGNIEAQPGPLQATGGELETPSGIMERGDVGSAPVLEPAAIDAEAAAVPEPAEAGPVLHPTTASAESTRRAIHPLWLVAVLLVVAVAVWLVLRWIFSPAIDLVTAEAPSVVTVDNAVRVTWRVRNASRVDIDSYAQGVDAAVGAYTLRSSTPVAAKALTIRASNIWGSAEAMTAPVGFTAAESKPAATATTAPPNLVAIAAPSPSPLPTATRAPLATPTASAPPPTQAPVVAAPAATVAPTATPNAADAWTTTANGLNAVWGNDWPGTLALLDAFVQRYPNYQPAIDKLYAALISFGDHLAQQGDTSSAETQYLRAKALAPDRPEADAALTALTPTPVQQPQGPRQVRPAPTKAPAIKPVYIPGE